MPPLTDVMQFDLVARFCRWRSAFERSVKNLRDHTERLP